MSVTTLHHLTKPSNLFVYPKHDLEESGYSIKKKRILNNRNEEPQTSYLNLKPIPTEEKKIGVQGTDKKKPQPFFPKKPIQPRPEENQGTPINKKVNKLLEKYLYKIKWHKKDFVPFEDLINQRNKLSFLPHIRVPDEFNNTIIPVLPKALYENK
jgi:hypothetical protein